jgi:hypothetical protein
MHEISLTFSVFQLEISGKDFKDVQKANIPHIFLILLVSHFEISGKVSNDEHPQNIKLISSTLSVFHFDISGKNFNDEKLLFSKRILFHLDKLSLENNRISLYIISL